MSRKASAAGGAPPSFDAIPVDNIPADGLDGCLAPDAEERAAIAVPLGLAGLERFEFKYSIRPLGEGRFRLTGAVYARVVQECVVTLDPVMSDVTEKVDLEFWPQDDVDVLERGEEGGLQIPPDGPEPLTGGAINPGQLAYEILAANLDPYPRKPGAEFKWASKEEKRSESGGGPFAALSKLRDREDT